MLDLFDSNDRMLRKNFMELSSSEGNGSILALSSILSLAYFGLLTMILRLWLNGVQVIK